jgi:hypothetical protein
MVVATVVVLSHVLPARGQGWSADVSAGRLVYDPLSATVDTSTVMGAIRRDTPRGIWVYGAGALPAGDAGTFWAATGTGGRVMAAPNRNLRARVGADLGAHGFWFRDRVVSVSGTGGTLEAMPFLRVTAGNGFVDGVVGWRGHTLSYAGLRENRGVFETGARGGYGIRFRVEGDARWVHADERTYPFVGATVAYQRARAEVWGQVGKWLATDFDDRAWAVGSGARLNARTSVWGSVRQDAPDPLYWNSARRTWSIGLTQRLGRIPVPLVPVSPSPGGLVVIRLRAADTPSGVVSIAGDFNNWQAVPMLREGSDWVIRLPLTPGVYHYSFRSSSGEWFVPASAAGRRDDGMGGHQAVLVVS